MVNRKDDSMSEFFRTGYKDIISNTILVELGKGRGIGNISGSYQLYAMKISKEGSIESTQAVLGTEIKSLDSNEPIAINTSENNVFDINELPTMLVDLKNITNSISVMVEWKDLSTGEMAIPSYYMIPSAHSQGYAWWDSYSVMFNIPELSERPEGKYVALITIKDIGTGNILSTTDTFTIKANKNVRNSNINSMENVKSLNKKVENENKEG